MRLAILIAFTIGCSATVAHCQHNQSAEFEFVVYLWGLPQVNDADQKAGALAEAGFTVVDWDPDEIDVLSKYKLKAMIHQPSSELVKRLATNPLVWGYHCVDEPYPEKLFEPLAKQVAELHAAAPNQYAFVNMLSVGGEFLRKYMAVVKPRILSFDYYQWWWGQDRYFEKLEQFRDAARLADVPLGTCIEASANPTAESGSAEYLEDNANKLRTSVYTSLAYGVKSIEWFSAAMVFESSSTRLTRAGQDVVELNKELASIGPVLAELESVDVFHSRSMYRGTRTIPKDHWIQVNSEASKPSVVVGMFVDEQDDFILLANSSYDQANTVSVKLQSKWLGIAPWNKPKSFKYSVQAFNIGTGEWQTITSSSSSGFVTVLRPGNGRLFRVRTEFDEEP